MPRSIVKILARTQQPKWPRVVGECRDQRYRAKVRGRGRVQETDKNTKIQENVLGPLYNLKLKPVIRDMVDMSFLRTARKALTAEHRASGRLPYNDRNQLEKMKPAGNDVNKH